MSKDKSAKKDKLKKLDLFSMMMEQSAVFRDMVARFQGAFGLPTLTISATSDTPQPAAPPATARESDKARTVKAPASGKAAAKTASTRKSAKPAAPPTAARKAPGKTAPGKKSAPAKKVSPPAVQKTPSRSPRKTAAHKAPAGKK